MLVGARPRLSVKASWVPGPKPAETLGNLSQFYVVTSTDIEDQCGCWAQHYFQPLVGVIGISI